jgi:hypothetical protein
MQEVRAQKHQHINLLLRNISRILPRMKLSITIQLGVTPLSQCELLIIDESRRHLTPTLFEVGFELFKHGHPVAFTGFPVKSQPVEGRVRVISIIVVVVLRPIAPSYRHIQIIE